MDGRSRVRVLKTFFEHGVLLKVAYDGTEFHGFQAQPGVRTVESVFDAALARMGARHGKLRVASRTDAGVHAEGQVVAFDVDRTMPMKGWALRLNTLLPADVAVREATPCAPDYVPRFDSVGKTYRYQLYVGSMRDPLRSRRYWFLTPALSRKDRPRRGESIDTFLDLEAMRLAADCLLGTHDFNAFRAANDPRENTVRTLRSIRLFPSLGGADDALAIEVEGDAFLKNMVRILVGTLVDVGRHYTSVEDVARMLEPGKDRRDAGPTAPPQGLTLVRVVLGRSKVIEGSE